MAIRSFLANGRLACAAVLATVTASIAAPPTCDEIVAALERESDPAAAAEALDTTQARISACTKLRDNQERHQEQRAKLGRDRAERGID